jgi:predicted aspartyl protease
MLNALTTVTAILLAVACADSLAAPTLPDTSAVTAALPAIPATMPPATAIPAVIGPEGDEAELFATPTRLDRIGRIVVPVMINGRGPFRFIVDTGASHSTISPELARKLGLPVSGELTIEVNGITGTAQVPAVRIERLEAGDWSVHDSDFPVVWAPLMAGADGILGAAGLKEQRLFVDFLHNRVVITRATRTGTPSGFLKIPATRLKGGLVSVSAMIGGVRVQAVIDTGSERSLGNLALQRALSARSRFVLLKRPTNVYGATDTVVSGDEQVAPTIAISDIRIADVTVTYGDFHIFQVWNMENDPALIIGMDILGTLESLSIDFQHQSFLIGGAKTMKGGDMGDVRSIGGMEHRR